MKREELRGCGLRRSWKKFGGRDRRSFEAEREFPAARIGEIPFPYSSDAVT